VLVAAHEVAGRTVCVITLFIAGGIWMGIVPCRLQRHDGAVPCVAAVDIPARCSTSIKEVNTAPLVNVVLLFQDYQWADSLYCGFDSAACTTDGGLSTHSRPGIVAPIQNSSVSHR